MIRNLLISASMTLLIAAAPVSGARAVIANERSYQFSEAAIMLFNRGDYRGAVIQLKNAIQHDARNVAARVLLGRAYLRLGDGRLAERELLLAQRVGAHPNLIVVPLGRSYLLQRKYKQVLNEINRGRRGNRLEAAVLDIRGRAYVALHDLQQAEAAFTSAVRLRPHAAFPLLGLVRVRMEKRELDEAENLVNKAIEIDPQNADAWHQKAEIRRAKRDNATALRGYAKAIEYRPNHIPAHLGRGAVLLDLKRYDEALDEIRFVRERAPLDARAAYLQSIALTRLGRINEARAVLTEAENNLKKLPPDFVRNDPPSLLLLGVIGFARKNFEDAYQYLGRYIELDPDHPGARILLGSMLLRKDDAGAAIKTLRPALRFAPDDFDLLTLLGTAYLRVKQFAPATEMLEKASSLAPDRARIHTLLGLSRIASGQSDQGIDDLETALSLAPDGSRPEVLLGLFHIKNGKYDKALETAKSIEKHDPSNPFAQNLAGVAEMSKGNKTEARQRFEAALRIDPAYLPAYFNLAKLDIADGNTTEAIDRLYEILRIEPNNIKAMRALADIALTQSRFDDAIKLLKEITSIDPNGTEHQTLLVDLYLRRNQVDPALNLARDLEIVHPTKVTVLMALGRALLAANKYSDAATRFGRIAELTRQSPEPLRRAALLQEKARDFDGARRTLRKAAALDPNYLPVQIALIRLEARDKNFKRAMELAHALRHAHPEVRAGDMIAGDLLMRMRRYGEASQAYAAAFAKKKDFDIVQRWADAKYRAGQTGEAFDLIADWAKNNPDDLFAKRLLASALRRAGRLREAIELNEKLLARAPDDPALLNNLAGLYQLVGDRRALSFGEKAFGLAPEHPVILDTFGWILVMSGDTERGITLLRQAFTRAADKPEVRYHLAVALNRTGRPKEAREELEKALEVGEAFEGIRDARALLRRLSGG